MKKILVRSFVYGHFEIPLTCPDGFTPEQRAAVAARDFELILDVLRKIDKLNPGQMIELRLVECGL